MVIGQIIEEAPLAIKLNHLRVFREKEEENALIEKLVTLGITKENIKHIGLGFYVI